MLDSRHGWEKGGSEGAAIVPGKPEESLLMEAVRYESYEMPPDEQLPARRNCSAGKMDRDGSARSPRVAGAEIDPEKLWALQPITKPAVPTVKDAKWPRDDLDAFILRRLEPEGLSPTGDADRYTLLRRVTFDLTGLPPTPEEIEAFINDQSDRAYEKVVDRLLDSPGFGDHWARHWFDLSCYADLADIQGNVLIRDAWRYRDYVIAAFNSDKPLDRFIHEQIAGDLLPYDSVEQRREQIIATGYLAIGPWTLQNYIKGQLDADVVDHQIDRIGRTFLGQTLSCARCHDHKFDPVPTADYYALAGIFHSTLHDQLRRSRGVECDSRDSPARSDKARRRNRLADRQELIDLRVPTADPSGGVDDLAAEDSGRLRGECSHAGKAHRRERKGTHIRGAFRSRARASGPPRAQADDRSMTACRSTCCGKTEACSPDSVTTPVRGRERRMPRS